MMLKLLALTGAIPALVVMLIVDRADARRPEPRSTLRMVALLGALSMAPIYFVELVIARFAPMEGLAAAFYGGFVVAALPEEAAKAAVVRFFVWRRPELDERTDGIVYGVRAGLGFAMVENISYLLHADTMTSFVTTFIGRGLLTVPIHAMAGGLMGHYATWRRFEGRGPGLIGGYAVAVALHGSFDVAFFALPVLAREERWLLALLCPAVILLLLIVGVVTLRKAWRRAVVADDAARA